LLQFTKLHRNHQIHWSPKPKTPETHSLRMAVLRLGKSATHVTHTSVNVIAPRRTLQRTTCPPINLMLSIGNSLIEGLLAGSNLTHNPAILGPCHLQDGQFLLGDSPAHFLLMESVKAG
jgi:hypothetical protein